MTTQMLEDILQLSVSERLQLIEDIWDTIAADPEQIPLSQAQKDELQRRMEEYERNPEQGITRQQLQDELSSLS